MIILKTAKINQLPSGESEIENGDELFGQWIDDEREIVFDVPDNMVKVYHRSGLAVIPKKTSVIAAEPGTGRHVNVYGIVDITETRYVNDKINTRGFTVKFTGGTEVIKDRSLGSSIGYASSPYLISGKLIMVL